MTDLIDVMAKQIYEDEIENLVATMPDSSQEVQDEIALFEKADFSLTLEGAEILLLDTMVAVLASSIQYGLIPDPGKHVFQVYDRIVTKLDVIHESFDG